MKTHAITAKDLSKRLKNDAITANSYHSVLKKSTKINENKCYHTGLLSQHGKNYQNLRKTNAVTENRYHSVEKMIKIHKHKYYHSEELSQR